MRSRDRRSRLASFASRHPDFFNLYHPPLHHLPTPHGLGFLVSGHSPIRHAGYLDHRLSAFVVLSRQSFCCDGTL